MGHTTSIRQRRRRAVGPTQDELRELREQWGHVPVKELAARLNISRRTAFRWAEKAKGVPSFDHEVPSRRYTILSLAAKLGVKPRKVTQWMHNGMLDEQPARGEDGERYDFSDTGVWQLCRWYHDEVFPHGASREQLDWLMEIAPSDERKGRAS